MRRGLKETPLPADQPCMRPTLLRLTLATSLALTSGCQLAVPGSGPAWPGRADDAVMLPDLAVARAPFQHVDVNWKQRLAQPYVYLEARGSYTQVGGLLEELHARMSELGVASSGPPFGLYYDDPGRVAVAQLRMRACFPVAAQVAPERPLGFDVLESTTVVYAFIGGPYPEVPRAYAGLYAFMRELGWVENGPLREVYLVNPATVESYDALVAEVQIPATSAGR